MAGKHQLAGSLAVCGDAAVAELLFDSGEIVVHEFVLAFEFSNSRLRLEIVQWCMNRLNRPMADRASGIRSIAPIAK